MEPIVACLDQDTSWIEGTQSEVVDHWTHLIGGLICMGITLVPHPGDIIIIVIIFIGGVSTYLRNSRNSSSLHLMER